MIESPKNPPNIFTLLASIALIVGVIYFIVHRSSPEVQYGQVYEITEGFYRGCTGKAVRATGSTVTVNNVVCITDSLDIEVTVPQTNVVMWHDPSEAPTN